jgi:uncharacterized membrane protein YgdD (TMEM256/DUF423 family)
VQAASLDELQQKPRQTAAFPFAAGSNMGAAGFGSEAISAMDRFFIFAGGLAGAAGVALSAAAAHGGGHDIGIAAPFLLVHATTLLAIGFFGRGRVLTVGGAILLAGLVIFCGDLVMRDFAGQRLFPMAAPAGGTAMILGWLVIAASAFTRRER